jgi:NADH:ubiquinone oxidoreductase subunit
MKTMKMYRIEYAVNRKARTEFLASDAPEKIRQFISEKRKPDGNITLNVEYEIGDVIEYNDAWAEDDSNGRTKKAVIWGFANDRLRVDTGWERWFLYARDGYKVIGRVSVNNDGYIADWEEARKAVSMGAAA